MCAKMGSAASSHADETYSLFCLTYLYYGECKENYTLFQGFLVNTYYHNKVSQKSKVTEKLIAQTAKEQDLAFSKTTGGYARSRQKTGSSTPQPA